MVCGSFEAWRCRSCSRRLRTACACTPICRNCSRTGCPKKLSVPQHESRGRVVLNCIANMLLIPPLSDAHLCGQAVCQADIIGRLTPSKSPLLRGCVGSSVRANTRAGYASGCIIVMSNGQQEHRGRLPTSTPLQSAEVSPRVATSLQEGQCACWLCGAAADLLSRFGAWALTCAASRGCPRPSVCF